MRKKVFKIGELSETLIAAESLDEACEILVDYMRKLKAGKIGYVAGLVTSEGPENIAKNVAILNKWTEKLRRDNAFPIFSSNDVFGVNELWKKLEKKGHLNHEYEEFWRKVFNSGVVTDVFMTPRWEKSHGATDEHETAKKLELEIHYLVESL